ncbi:MAG: hypothetical protein ACK456_11640 [Pseudanabaenaceae cyanobacterium]|jgi:hypothetical protein
MNRTLFILTLVLIGVLVLVSSLPNKLYVASDRKFMVATVITVIFSLVGLAMFFAIR